MICDYDITSQKLITTNDITSQNLITTKEIKVEVITLHI